MQPAEWSLVGEDAMEGRSADARATGKVGGLRRGEIERRRRRLQRLLPRNKRSERSNIEHGDKGKGKAAPSRAEAIHDTEALVHDLQTNQIELEMQNEELRRAQAELEESQSRYANLFDFMPVGCFIFDSTGRVIAVNHAGAKLLGAARSGLVKTLFSDYVAFEEQDTFYLHCKEVLRTGLEQTCELKLRRAGNTELYVQLISRVALDGQGKAGHLHTAVIDITQQKRTEAGLQQAKETLEEQVAQRTADLAQAEKRHRTIADFNCDWESWETPDETLIYVSPSCERISGYPPQAFIDHPTLFEDIIVPEDRDLWDQHRIEGKTESGFREAQFRIRTRTGAIRWIERACQPVTDDQGEFLGLRASNRDITRRKQAEEKVHEISALLERIFDTTHFSIVYLDRDFNFVRVNKAYAKACGHPADFFSGKNHFDLYPHEENETIFRQVVETGELFTIYAKPFEFPEHPEWGVTYWDWTLHPVKDVSGQVQGLVFALVDVTRHKQAEHALKESEQKYRTMFNNAQVGLALTRISDGKMVACNDKLAQILGYDSPERCVAKYIASEHYTNPQSRQTWVSELQERGHVKDHVTQVTRCDGVPIWVMFSAYIVPEEGCIQGAVIDITERKRVEDELTEYRERLEELVQARTLELERANSELMDSEAKLTAIFEQAAVGVAVIDTATGHFLTLNQRYCDIVRYTRGEMLRLDFQTITHPEDLQADLDSMERLVRGEIREFNMEKRYFRKDGSIVWVSLTVSPLWKPGEPASSHIAVVEDITERKAAESTRRMALFAEMDPAPVLRFAASGVALSLNSAAKEILGEKAVEGVPLEVIIPRLSFDPHECIQRDLTLKAEDEMSGRWFQFVVVGISALNVGHIYGSDITERKQAEQKIFQHQQQLRSLSAELSIVEERERRRLAMILHDDIGQQLASSKMLVDLQMEDGLPEDAMKALAEVGLMLEQAAEQAHDLTFDLSTPILYEFGLAKAVREWLAREAEDKHKICATFTDHGIPDALDEDVAVFVFRSIRELAFNAVKHAQPRNLAVSVDLDADQMIVEVTDDGKGFNYESLGESCIKGSGFGLFSIRERLEYMGGEFSVDSERGAGTRIVLRVPAKLEMVPPAGKGDESYGNTDSIGR